MSTAKDSEGDSGNEAHPTRGRPKDAAKEAAIVEAARDLFLAHGLAAVSMDAVAAAAGVSKRTVYSRFADKEALFYAVIEREVPGGPPFFAEPPLTDAADLRARLFGFGCRLMHLLSRPGVLDLGRLLIYEARRHPQLARRFYEFGPGASLRYVTDLFDQARTRGILDLPDASVAAAERYLGMFQGLGHLRRQLGLDPPPTEEEIAAFVGPCIDLIFKAYRPT